MIVGLCLFFVLRFVLSFLMNCGLSQTLHIYCIAILILSFATSNLPYLWIREISRLMPPLSVFSTLSCSLSISFRVIFISSTNVSAEAGTSSQSIYSAKDLPVFFVFSKSTSFIICYFRAKNSTSPPLQSSRYFFPS